MATTTKARTKAGAKTTAKRMSAGERRAQIIDAARAEFAVSGLHGTSTDKIARRAGVSQPYLFRLFGTKKQLFIQVIEGCYERVATVFAEAAAAAPKGSELEHMGKAYGDLLEDRVLLLGQMQAYAACADDEIRAVVQRGYAGLYAQVARLSGATPDELRLFFAAGMLMNVAAAIDLPQLTHDDGWAERHLDETRSA